MKKSTILQDPNYNYDSNILIDDIKNLFKKSHGPFFTMFEVGLDELRFDCIRVNPYKQYVRIFEFKSGRADFISDKKWWKYLKYCHTFTFVCPLGAIQKSDLLPRVGLIWVYKWQHVNHDKDSWFIASDWVKRPKKQNVNHEILLKLAFIMIKRMIDRPDKVI